ncbi:MAG: glycosyl hydrolase 115 family protein, partial [Chitinophagaceae bacterium]|nr:glycosyl hydrolase 115 family protein [Chitinophagaceae bacterium]
MLVYKKLVSVCLFLAIAIALHAQKEIQPLKISTIYQAESFSLVANNQAASISVDSNEATVVHLAANYFINDVASVTGTKPIINNRNASVVIGTIGKSSFINKLIASKKINVDAIKRKWEAYMILILNEASKKTLFIIGSDDRGTAFGIFELSRKIGVHPFYWWADIVPEHKPELFVAGSLVQQSPAVQYRGIFLNDEDWGLQPWAAKKMDTDIKDIGPRTYEKIFELLLRLK